MRRSVETQRLRPSFMAALSASAIFSRMACFSCRWREQIAPQGWACKPFRLQSSHCIITTNIIPARKFDPIDRMGALAYCPPPARFFDEARDCGINPFIPLQGRHVALARRQIKSLSITIRRPRWPPTQPPGHPPPRPPFWYWPMAPSSRDRGSARAARAVGEVCFNTALTGYQEILTDPSYASQIVTFTFPHIGNIGANDEDIEDLDPGRPHGRRRRSAAGVGHQSVQLPLGLASRRVAEAARHRGDQRRRYACSDRPHFAKPACPTQSLRIRPTVASTSRR